MGRSFVAISFFGSSFNLLHANSFGVFRSNAIVSRITVWLSLAHVHFDFRKPKQ